MFPGDFKLDGLVQSVRVICGIVPITEGAVGVSAVLGELGDEGLLALAPHFCLSFLSAQGEPETEEDRNFRQTFSGMGFGVGDWAWWGCFL